MSLLWSGTWTWLGRGLSFPNAALRSDPVVLRAVRTAQHSYPKFFCLADALRPIFERQLGVRTVIPN
jgi:hypothetical protein